MTEGKVSRLAALYACDRAYDALVGSREPLRVKDIALSIKESMEVPRRLLREWLEGEERFVALGRKFDLRLRAEGKTLTVEAFIKRALRESGRPLPLRLLALLLSEAKKGSPERMMELASKIMAEREDFFPLGEGEFGLSEWLLNLPSEDEEEVILFNFFERCSEVKGVFDNFDPSGIDPEEGHASIAKAILARMGKPVESKMLALLAWKVLGERFDPVEFYSSLLRDEEVFPLSDGTWCLKQWVKEARDWVMEKAKEAPAEALEVTPQMVLEALSRGEEALELSSEERKGVMRLFKRAKVLSVTEAVEKALDISPEDEEFLPASLAVYHLFKADQRLEPVGLLSFAFKEAIPREISEVPKFLLPHPPATPPDAEESPDVLLEDEGLEGNLAHLVHSPELEDIGEEEEAPQLPEEALPEGEAVYVVLFHHYTSGVIKVRKLDRKVIPAEPKFLRITLLTPEGERKAWVNNELGLLFLGADFFPRMGFPPSGGKLRLKPSDSPDAFHTEMVGTESKALISPERTKELANLREKAEGEEFPTFEIVRGIVERHKKGAEFLTIFAEVNMVRRTSKRMVASILSGYHCFYRRHSQPHLWTWDERRLAQGFKSAKKKYLRRG